MQRPAPPYVLWGCLSLKQWIKRSWKKCGAAALLVSVILCSRYEAAFSHRPALAVQQPPNRIVIDAGHGGEDGGATGVAGTRECEVNLAVSLRLQKLLQLAGHEPVMIRTTDTAVYSAGARTISEKKVSDIHNRVQLLNNTPGALLVSIHQNFFTEEKYSGAQVFYADDAFSRALAEQLQAQLRAALDPDNRREAKSAAGSVYLMNHIQVPGILVECGFLSNAAEEDRLNTPAYQTKLAMTMAAVLLQNLEGTNEV